MNINKFSEIKKKDTIQVRVDMELYKKVSNIAKIEGTSIVKTFNIVNNLIFFVC